MSGEVTFRLWRCFKLATSCDGDFAALVHYKARFEALEMSGLLTLFVR